MPQATAEQVKEIKRQVWRAYANAGYQRDATVDFYLKQLPYESRQEILADMNKPLEEEE